MICTIRDVDCCAYTKSFNTAIPVRSLGPYMCVHYCTCIVHILVWTYLFHSTSFFDCLSFFGLFLKHPYKRFFPFHILYFYLSRSLFLSLSLSTSLCLSLSLLISLCLCFFLSLSLSLYLKRIRRNASLSDVERSCGCIESTGL